MKPCKMIILTRISAWTGTIYIEATEREETEEALLCLSIASTMPENYKMKNGEWGSEILG